jgi:ribonuclease Z
VFHEVATVVEEPIESAGTIARGAFGTLEARRLDHPVESFGYRLVEASGRRMLPEALDRFGIRGPEIGRLRREGTIRTDTGVVTVEQVSVHREGQRFAFVMDTRLCDGVYALAEQADLLVIESTFATGEAALAARYGHLTAAQAGQVAAECGVRKLVLTHFSQRYDEPARLRDEAAERFDGEIVVAEDLARIAVPKRRRGDFENAAAVSSSTED